MSEVQSLQRQQNDELRNMRNTHATRMKIVNENQGEALRELKMKHSEEMSDEQYDHDKELASMKNHHDREIDKTEQLHKTQRERYRSAASQRIKNLETAHKQQIDGENGRFERSFKISRKNTDEMEKSEVKRREDLRKRYSTSYKQMSTSYEKEKNLREVQDQKNLKNLNEVHKKRLTSNINRNDNEILTERTRAKHSIDTTRKAHNEEMTELRTQNDTNIIAENRRSKKTLDTIQKTHNETLESKNEEHEASLNKINDTQTKTIMNNNKAFEERLLKQRNTIDENVKLLKSVGDKYKEKVLSENANEITTYQAKSHDPFYKMVKAGLKVEENEKFYVAEAEIPEHEKANMYMTVQDGLVRFSGTRSNEQRITEKGKNIFSNNFNTFIETIPIPRAVDMKAITRDYKNGVLTMMIPKI